MLALVAQVVPERELERAQEQVVPVPDLVREPVQAQELAPVPAVQVRVQVQVQDQEQDQEQEQQLLVVLLVVLLATAPLLAKLMPRELAFMATLNTWCATRRPLLLPPRRLSHRLPPPL